MAWWIIRIFRASWISLFTIERFDDDKVCIWTPCRWVSAQGRWILFIGANGPAKLHVLLDGLQYFFEVITDSCFRPQPTILNFCLAICPSPWTLLLREIGIAFPVDFASRADANRSDEAPDTSQTGPLHPVHVKLLVDGGIQFCPVFLCIDPAPLMLSAVVSSVVVASHPVHLLLKQIASVLMPFPASGGIVTSFVGRNALVVFELTCSIIAVPFCRTVCKPVLKSERPV